MWADSRPWFSSLFARQNRETGLGGSVLGSAGNVGEERVAHVENDQTDRATATLAQLACGEVAHETQLLDRRVNPGQCGRCDLLRMVHHVGHGSHRNARALGDILDAYVAHAAPLRLNPFNCGTHGSEGLALPSALAVISSLFLKRFNR